MSRLKPRFPYVAKLPTPLRELAYKDERLCIRLDRMLELDEVALQDVTFDILFDLAREIGNIETVLAEDATVDGKKKRRVRERRARFVACVWLL